MSKDKEPQVIWGNKKVQSEDSVLDNISVKLFVNSWRKAIDKIADEHNRSYPNVTQEDEGVVYDYSQMDTLPTVEQVLESLNMNMSEYSMLNPSCKVRRCVISEEDGNFVARICLDKEDKSG